MLNTKRRLCSDGSCLKRPSYGEAGSKKAEFCSKHARTEMGNVVNKKRGYEGCSTLPSGGVATSRRAEAFYKHPTAGMVSAVHKLWEDRCPKSALDKKRNDDEATNCQQYINAHDSAAVSNTIELDNGEGPCCSYSTGDGGGLSLIHI